MTDTPQQWWYVFDEQTRILVVDDDPILREFASVYLTTPMSTVALAPDASTALELLAREQFDIALVDIRKPRGDVFLDELEAILRERGIAVLREAKPTFTKPAPSCTSLTIW